jgi:peptidoglycan-associated lipoprotein
MMRSGNFRGWGVWMLALALAVAVGCARKEVVKSTEVPPAPEAVAPTAVEEGIVTEPVDPGVRETDPLVAMAPPGIAATMEQPSLFPDIRFDFDKSFIREDAKPVLMRIAEHMKGSPAASLLIEGHCDERGTAEYNMALGERRAEAAKRYLVSLGVRQGAISTVSFGKEKPLDPRHNEEAWAKNRRAHFVLK